MDNKCLWIVNLMENSGQQQFKIVNYVRTHGPSSRGEIAKSLGITLHAAGGYVRDLIESGMFVEDGFDDSTGGRPRARVRVNAGCAFVVGIHVGMRGVQGALLNLDGEVITRHAEPDSAGSGIAETLDAVNRLVTTLTASISGDALAGIGIGVSGVMREGGCVSRDFPHAEQWVNVPLANMIEARCGMRPEVLSDVHAAALAELRLGACREMKNFVFLHVGYGIAAGVVAEGKLVRGATGNAGEVGHIVLDENGPLCYCGNRGCLESMASPRAVVEACKHAISRGVRTLVPDEAENPAEITFAHILRAAERDDRLAANLLGEAGHHIGQVAASLISVFDPEALVLGGLLSGSANALTEALERTARARALPPLRQAVRIEISQLGDAAPMLGAGASALDLFFANPAALRVRRAV